MQGCACEKAKGVLRSSLADSKGGRILCSVQLSDQLGLF